MRPVYLAIISNLCEHVVLQKLKDKHVACNFGVVLGQERGVTGVRRCKCGLWAVWAVCVHFLPFIASGFRECCSHACLVAVFPAPPSPSSRFSQFWRCNAFCGVCYLLGLVVVVGLFLPTVVRWRLWWGGGRRRRCRRLRARS